MAGILDNPVGASPILQVDPNANTLHAVGPGGILSARTDYVGQHEAPDMESGAPLHNVASNGIYPSDFYGPKGFDYYNPANEGGMDRSAYQKILAAKDQPDQMVKVYRAIPWDGPPPGILHSGGPAGGIVNPGDWVAINKDYAKMHGESHLNGNYALVTKKVPARELFTNGDSFHEWGWDPRASQSK